jgi:hypothetical protein
MLQHKLKLAVGAIAVAALSFTAGSFAQPRYPEIVAAEASLQTAMGQLRAARDVFGGHKAAAERLIGQAIGELQEGKAFAASHGM